jgi:hypothetical protein
MYVCIIYLMYVRFEIFTTVTMKNAVFRNVMQIGSCINLCFGGRYRLHHQGDKNQGARKDISSN